MRPTAWVVASEDVPEQFSDQSTAVNSGVTNSVESSGVNRVAGRATGARSGRTWPRLRRRGTRRCRQFTRSCWPRGKSRRIPFQMTVRTSRVGGNRDRCRDAGHPTRRETGCGRRHRREGLTRGRRRGSASASRHRRRTPVRLSHRPSTNRRGRRRRLAAQLVSTRPTLLIVSAAGRALAMRAICASRRWVSPEASQWMALTVP
jgi:hypothetical protein